MQKLVFTNANGDSVDFTDFENYCVTSWEGFANVSQEVQSQTVPFHDGSVYIDTLLNDRDLTITVAMNDRGNLQRRYELKENLISILNPKMGIGKLVYTNDCLSRQISVVTAIPVFPTKNINNSGTLKFSVSFTANDPYWEDLDETEITVHNHETVSVDNDSDFPLNVKMSIDGASENPSIYNLTNQSMVSLRGNFDNLEISSLFGKKSVTSTENKFVYNTGEFFLIVTNDTQLMKVTNGVIINDIYGNVKEFYDFEDESTFDDMVYSKYFGLYVGSKSGYDDDSGNGYVDIYTSPNGLDWTHVRKLIDATEELPRRISVDDVHGKILLVNWNLVLSSTNCIDWNLTDISSVGNMTVMNDCIYCEFLNSYICIGSTSSKPCVRISSDGLNWTETEINTKTKLSIACSNEKGLLVMAGFDGQYSVSSDGINWTNYETNSIYKWFKICYVEMINKFVCVGSDGMISVSADGGKTAPIDIINLNKDISFVGISSWINNLTIYINDAEGAILTSIDGYEWHLETENIGKTTSMAYSAKLNRFVVVGKFNRLYVSNDGKTWFVNLTNLPYYLYSVVWSDELEMFVAVGQNGLIYDSSDGLNWNRQTNSLTQSLWSIRWISEIEKFIVVGNSDFLISSDGLNWTAVALPTGHGVGEATIDTNIIYANGKLFTTDFSHLQNNYLRIYVSEDEGLTWNIQSIEKQNVYSIAGHIYHSVEKNLFFILGGISEQFDSWLYKHKLCLWTSSDGVNWIERPFSEEIYIESSVAILCCCVKKDNVYFAITNTGKVFSSSNIFDWSMVNDFSYTFNTMILAQDSIYIGGNQIIMNSKDEPKNSINSLTNNSNMDFKIEVGENKIFYVNKINSDLKISFRKKYLGV